MNRFRNLAIGALSIMALTAAAQPLAAARDEQSQHTIKSNPIVERQLQSLTVTLGLTPDQQTRVRSILEEMHEATVKLVQDESLSRDERLHRVWPLRLNADRQIRQILTDMQKAKLDQFEQEPHPEMHADLQ